MDKLVDKLLKSRGKLSIFSRNIDYLACCIALLYLISPSSVYSQLTLSSDAEITLLTCDPGDQLYSTYGHTSFRVFDPANGLDDVYNYGTFDFETPGFYLKFVRGKLNYLLTIGDYQAFRRWYMAHHRSVYEQILFLSPGEKQAFYEFLYNNSLPENREYLYDYFFKNCSSVPRDIIYELTGETWIPDSALNQPGAYTFRELIHEKLTALPWAQFGIDLILGMKIDRKASPYEQMFLPEHLMTYMAKVKRNIKGREAPLVISEQQIVFGNPIAPYEGILPIHVTWIFFILVAAFTAWQFFKKNTHKLLDVILFFLAGLAGILMVVMWIGTDHSTATHNLNLLWALPTHMFIAFILLRSHPPAWLSTYFLVAAAAHLLFLLGHPLLPQYFHPAALPLVCALLLRSIYLWRQQSFLPIK